MSIQFNGTRGLVQMYERETSQTRGAVSGNTDRLKDFAADANIALDRFQDIAIKHSGTWQADDTNHSDFPIITTNLVSGQRDYTFLTDENGNSILDVHRVFVKDGSGTFVEVKPVDAQTDKDTNGFWNGQNVGGVPTKYDKTANGIFLDPVPNYNSTGGLKVYISREASYFTYTDTTKKPGAPSLFHEYFFLLPARDFARRNGLANFNLLELQVQKVEEQIKDYFSMRPRDERRRLTPAYQNNH